MATIAPSASIAFATLPSPPVSSTSSQINQAAPVSTAIHASASAHSPGCAQTSSFQYAKKILPKITAVIVFAVTVPGIAVIVWTKQGLDVSNKSLKLAQWTAKKDYFEFCQNQQQTTQTLSQECNSILRTMLEEPPLLKRLLGLRFTAKRGHALSQDQSKQDSPNSLLIYVPLIIAAVIILLAVSGILTNVDRQRAIVYNNAITGHSSILKAKTKQLLTRLCQVLPRVEFRRTKPHDRHRCLTFEHDCHLHASEASSTAVGSSAVELPISSTATITEIPNGELRQRIRYRPQDTPSTFRFKAMSPDNKGTFELTGVLDANALYSLISISAARKCGRPLETTEFFFARNQEPVLSYVGQFALPSTDLLRLPLFALDGSGTHKEMELFVVDEEFDTDCVLAPGFEAATFGY